MAITTNQKWVLIVEDDRDLATMLRDQLSENGYQVIMAHRLSDAFAKLNNQRFSCIVVDLRLEQNSGLKIINQIKSEKGKDDFNHDCPIILISGQLDIEVIKSVAGKIQAVMIKPFTAQELMGKIKELLTQDPSATKSLAKPGVVAPPPVNTQPLNETQIDFIHDVSGVTTTLSLAIDQLRDLIELKPGAAPEKEAMAGVETALKRLFDLIKAHRGGQ